MFSINGQRVQNPKSEIFKYTEMIAILETNKRINYVITILLQ